MRAILFWPGKFMDLRLGALVNMDREQQARMMDLVEGRTTVPHISEIARAGDDDTAGCRGLIATRDLPGGAFVAREEVGVHAPSPSAPGISICWGLVRLVIREKETYAKLLSDLADNPKLVGRTLATPGDAEMLRKLQVELRCDLESLKATLSKVLANFLTVYRGVRVDGKVQISVLAAIPYHYRLMNHSEAPNIRVCSPLQDIYYCTIRPVKAGEPLLIDYGAEHAELL